MRKSKLHLTLILLFILYSSLSSCLVSWLIKDEFRQEEKIIRKAKLDVKNDLFPTCLPNMNIEITHSIPVDLNSFIKEDFTKNIIEKEKSKNGTIFINAESLPVSPDSIGRNFTILLLNKDNKMIKSYTRQLMLSGKEYCSCNFKEKKDIKNIADPLLLNLYLTIRSEIKNDIIEINNSLLY